MPRRVEAYNWKMIIRFPHTFRAESAPVTITISEDDVKELLGDLPGTIEHFDESIHVSFESPRAAAAFVENLGDVIPYLASDMDIEEELLFNSILSEQGSVVVEPLTRPALAVAALSVAIPAAVLALIGITLGIIGIAV